METSSHGTATTHRNFAPTGRRVIMVGLVFLIIIAAASATAGEPGKNGQWSVERATNWYSQRAWPVGFNYLPRYAINQLEMWQEDSFDATIIEQELTWAAKIGFNTVRVYLHDLPWQQDAAGFTQRIDHFLQITQRHGFEVIFVLFDDVWDPLPQAGQQRSPRPEVHNSGWVQSPGAEILGNPSRHDELEPYVRGIISRYADDTRVAIWDLYNEPGNLNTLSYGKVELDNKPLYSLALLNKVFAWARDENPSQPLTSAVWRVENGNWLGQKKDDPGAALFDFMLQHSDIVTFHSYANAAETSTAIDKLAILGRPMVCTEYMARGHGSTFEAVLPLFAKNNIGAIHWGLVSGKSQTIYPWRSWVGIVRFWDSLFSEEPDPWHHDLLRADGSAYHPEEVQLIRAQISEKVAASR